MIEPEFARRFAEEWIAAWNSHDLEAILAHYEDDFEMASEKIARRMGEPSGKLRGKAAVGQYWAKGLQALPDLRFELKQILTGVDSLTLYYLAADGRMAAEYFQFAASGKVTRAAAHYSI
ncbi:MAG: nuclear transport factor 2 family protein [Blastocatellia bacterium]